MVLDNAIALRVGVRVQDLALAAERSFPFQLRNSQLDLPARKTINMDNDSVLNDDSGSLDHQACYIYTPTSEAVSPKKRRATSSSRVQRSKREKIDAKDRNTAKTRAYGFPTLLRDSESEDAVKARYQTLERLWADVERRTNVKFRGCLILTGPNIAAHGALFRQIESRIQNVDKHGRVAILTSKDSTNLKNVLKKTIKAITEIQSGLDDEDEVIEARPGRSTARYNYDPEIIQDWCSSHPDAKVVIAVQDTEAFDPAVLVDLITILQYVYNISDENECHIANIVDSQYLPKIPFVILLGVATSEDLFYEKIPHFIRSLLRGDRFDVQRFEQSMEQVFNEAVLSPRSLLKLGPRVADLMFERQKDFTRSVGTFLTELKYAYMSHFYANALSVLLSFSDNDKSATELLSNAHCEAIRNLPSFQNLVEATIPTFPWRARDLLTSNTSLKSAVLTASRECQRYSNNLAEAISLFRKIQSVISPHQANDIPAYELYSRVLLGEFTARPAFRDAMLTAKKLSSERFHLLVQVLAELPSELSSNFAASASKIQALQSEKATSSLVSEFVLPESHRTSVKSGRVRLDELRSGMTSQDTEYSKIVTSTLQTLESYFKERFKPYTNLFLHEVFFYDLRSPHSQVFAAKPRPSIERALSRPHDYLGCECCGNDAEDGDGAGIEGTQPYTALLYQLYLESPALIGIYDLWSAFRVVSLGEKAEEEGSEDDEEEKALQSLSELRYLGFVKYSKKKPDHLVKLVWKGL
ncbi:hypothetical protein Dda_7444 [Drechslerella dactyloides]|uniref:Origin recognition complex subunit n=1 Tax=Drechslerella dactyloides TaxID=74499 RepID=A0AAD6ISK8_DREDA|nr:hypothetical protein Dda_7444 [Drechslerella dactyloides]